MSNDVTLNLHEAADHLKIHPKTVEDLIRDGALPAGKIGRAYVLMKKDVIRYAESIILKQTADRLRAKSPKRIRKIGAPQISVAH
ncbi:helix-turn-helix domain-containing protein [Delftia sp. PS-11]|uniref:helix-turn-helix domain-containing protein n=1 Tax=Delftia sp. PS-11 TaxID=2767222 RepID=UPI002458DF50|nr:helix-turn-helix domain-containing protein [Delftia sp. PS-11]KAJ8745405.1 helix-turn-helix domain-containing protein [Delftia sp. PS-11]